MFVLLNCAALLEYEKIAGFLHDICFQFIFLSNFEMCFDVCIFLLLIHHPIPGGARRHEDKMSDFHIRFSKECVFLLRDGLF